MAGQESRVLNRAHQQDPAGGKQSALEFKTVHSLQRHTRKEEEAPAPRESCPRGKAQEERGRRSAALHEVGASCCREARTTGQLGPFAACSHGEPRRKPHTVSEPAGGDKLPAYSPGKQGGKHAVPRGSSAQRPRLPALGARGTLLRLRSATAQPGLRGHTRSSGGQHPAVPTRDGA